MESIAFPLITFTFYLPRDRRLPMNQPPHARRAAVDTDYFAETMREKEERVPNLAEQRGSHTSTIIKLRTTFYAVHTV